MKSKINLSNVFLKTSNFLSLIISLAIVFIVGDIKFGTLIVLGALFFYYYVPQDNKKGLKTVILTGSIGLCSFLIMTISSILSWLTPLLLGLLCAIFFFYDKLWNLTGPGSFFLVMISCIAGVHKYTNPYITAKSILFLLLGIIISVTLAIINEYLFDRFNLEKLNDKTNKFKIRVSQIPPNLLIKSFFYGFAIFLAYYVAENLNIFHFYWAVISCSSILQAESMPGVIKRHQHYLIGTLIGCLISYVILLIPLSIPTTILLLIIFNSLIYWKITTNFLIGNFFTTPMAILVTKLSFPALSDTSILSRFIAIIVGTTIAFVVVYILNYFQTKYIVKN